MKNIEKLQYKCVVCDKLIEHDSIVNEMVYDAVICHSHGNFGSTKFDPMNGFEIIFCICDDCLVKKSESICLIHPSKFKNKYFKFTDYLYRDVGQVFD